MTENYSDAVPRKSDFRSLHVNKLSESDRAKLREIATELGAYHGAEPSFPKVVKGIIEGKFCVSSTSKLIHSHIKEPLVELDVEVISDANGIMVLIARKISDRGGNIYFAKTEQYGSKKVIKIKFSVREEIYLLDIVKSIKKINFHDIEEFNNEKQIANILISMYDHYSNTKMTEPSIIKIIRDWKSSREKNDKEPTPRVVITEYEYLELISNVVLTIRLKAIVKNQPGVLMKLSNWISKRYISIRSVDISPLSDTKLGQIKINIGITSDMIDSLDQIKSIEEVVSELRKEKFVTNVEQISSM